MGTYLHQAQSREDSSGCGVRVALREQRLEVEVTGVSWDAERLLFWVLIARMYAVYKNVSKTRKGGEERREGEGEGRKNMP